MLPALNLALRFTLELCALAALAYWSFRTYTGAIRVALGLGAPALFAVLWSVFGSPRAVVPLSEPAKLLFELVVFGTAAAALAAAGRPALAWIFGAVLVINRILMIVWKQ